MAPLPRDYQWAGGSAFINPVELVRKAHGAEVPAHLRTNPPMYQGGNDDVIGPHENIVCASAGFGIDIEAEVAVSTGDVAMGSAPDAALEGLRLLTLANDVSLRHLDSRRTGQGLRLLRERARH